MAGLKNVSGVARAIAQLRARQRLYARNVEHGLKLAGTFLLHRSLEIVPVDTGYLKSGGFVRTDGSGFDAVVTAGYRGADYAVYVHENLDAAHGAAFNAKHADEIAAGTEHARGPNQQAKYLEQPLRDNLPEIVAIVRTTARAGLGRTTVPHAYSQYGPHPLPPGASGAGYGVPGGKP